MTSTTTTAAAMLLIVLSLLGNTMSSTFVDTMSSTFVTGKSGVPVAVAVWPQGLLYAVGLPLAFASVTLSANHYSSQRIVPSGNFTVVPLQGCEEEFDMTIREAKFAFRSTDLGREDGIKTDSDPKIFQHWALVVHFERGKKTYIFEAWKNESNGHLQPTRTEIPFEKFEVFTNAKFLGTAQTSPEELLTKAKQVKTGEYNVFLNNCQTWLGEFVRLFSLDLSISPSFVQNRSEILTNFNLETHISRPFVVKDGVVL